MKIVGVDPGKFGAIAVLDPERLAAERQSGVLDPLAVPEKERALAVYDMPLTGIQARGKSSQTVDHVALGALVRSFGAIDWVIVERVSAMPKQGVTSTFNFGRAVGIVLGVFAAIQPVPALVEVTPQAWRKGIALVGDKHAARRKASQYLPGYAALWSRAKEEGRSEATLIALHGARELGFLELIRGR